jgi:hypothetical protein
MALRIAGFLWLDRLSMMTTSPGDSVGTRHCSIWDCQEFRVRAGG